MHDATTQPSGFRLAIAPGVPSPFLSTLLALQRAEEPDTTITFFEVTGEELAAGLHEGHYDIGMALQSSRDAYVESRQLRGENMAIGISLQSPPLDDAPFTIAQLLNHPTFYWPAENCPQLDRQLSSLPPEIQQRVRLVPSFEMLATWIAAGHGVGISAESRLMRARAFGISVRPLSDGPYEIVTYLQRLRGHNHPAAERFERRALQMIQADRA